MDEICAGGKVTADPVDALGRQFRARILGAGCLAAVLAAAALAHAQSDSATPAQLIGTWRGTSLCTDRVAAPACKDETVVYEFTAGSKAGMVHWVADKVVDGERLTMGELDAEYDKTEGCWKSEFSAPRVKTVWCLVVDGDRLSGTGRLLPGKEMIRKMELRRDKPTPSK
jgi:hypothetical protein